MKSQLKTKICLARNIGFTLVELSIVLVIIALLVAGIVIGKDLIEAAQIRQQATQLETLQIQINAFRGKYNCLPGDCPNATQFFGTTSAAGYAVSNGNGDGLLRGQSSYVAGECTSPLADKEITQLFLHLNLAGMSDFASDGNSGTIGIGIPKSKIQPDRGILVTCMRGTSNMPSPRAMYNEGNTIALGVGTPIGSSRIYYRLGLGGTASNFSTFGILPAYAYALDAKIDDGIANTGRVGLLWDCGGISGYAKYTSQPSTCVMTIGKNIQ